MTTRFCIIGGGPAGIAAASVAASLGAEVTLIESSVVGGSAHLWDCVPSKAMTATGSELRRFGHSIEMGIATTSELDLQALRDRIAGIQQHLNSADLSLLESQEVKVVIGNARFMSANRVSVAEPSSGEALGDFEFDAVLIATGSSPRVPDFATIDGQQIMTTRDAYPPSTIPEHLVVVGSGVTGVEFTHMFSALGARVTLVVSRQHVLPSKDPEVAAVLEQEFERRGVELLKGARACSVEHTEDGVRLQCEDGRTVDGSHVVFAIGSVPNTASLGLEDAGVEMGEGGIVSVNRHCQTNIPHIYAAGDVSGKLPLSSVASMQGRKIAEHLMGLHHMPHRHLDYDKAASAIFTDPEVADVGIAEAEAFAEGRKIRVTKVPFATNPKALIDGDARGFVKVISDPATGVVLGGSIVGRHAAELISVLSLAVNAGLHTADLADTLFVHPTRAGAIAEASI